jgi:two-component system, LuxR family, sensor kinase FixL
VPNRAENIQQDACDSGHLFGFRNAGRKEKMSQNSGVFPEGANLPSATAWSLAVVETAVDAVITINSRGTIQRVNPATTQLFGYQPEDLIGKNVNMLMPEPHRSEHDQHLDRYLKTRKAAIIGIGRRVLARRADGSLFPAHLAVSEFSIDGEWMFNGVVRDLSELEQVQQQLVQSERLAAIGEMMTGLAHESRNALQRAQACLDMLSLDLAEMPEQLDLAKRAAGALLDLHRLYEEVRSYAAPIHLEVRSCDLTGVWRKQWDYLKVSHQGKHLHLVESRENSDAVCEVDVHRIDQVFRNILENAIYACPDGGTVTVTCHETTLNGMNARRIEISDDGCGMSPETVAYIFDPFYTTKQRGTGLGMAITRRIIESHSGSISAGSELGKGSQISILLPTQAVVRNAFRTVSH